MYYPIFYIYNYHNIFFKLSFTFYFLLILLFNLYIFYIFLLNLFLNFFPNFFHYSFPQIIHFNSINLCLQILHLTSFPSYCCKISMQYSWYKCPHLVSINGDISSSNVCMHIGHLSLLS